MPISRIPSWGRRRVLKAGALPFLGLDLPRLLAAEASPRDPGRPRREKSCIFIFQYGGLSQIDSWDPKPDGPSEIRGPYRPIATSVPGFHVGELMPRLARLADRYCVIRSMSHNVPVHDIANRMLLAGQSLPAMNAPSFGTMVSKLRPSGEGVPSQVWLQKFGGGSMPPDSTYLTGGILGMAHAPMLVGVEHDDNPANPDFRVDAFDMPDGALPRSRPGPDATAGTGRGPTGTRRRPPARSPGSASVPSTSSTGRRPAGRSTSTAKTPASATATAGTRWGRTCSWPAG